MIRALGFDRLRQILMRNHHGSVCLRAADALLLVYLLMAWSVFFFHLSTAIHFHDVMTGTTVHLSCLEQCDVFDEAGVTESGKSQNDHNDCPAFNFASMSSMPLPSAAVSASEISRSSVLLEIKFRQIERVYLSLKALSRAPKNSPPILV